jgi:choline-sulfatase
MTDQHRLDCVGAYSDLPVRTPNLDRLADRSVVFDRHYTTCPLCVPARSSLHTGRYPHSCGAMINGFGSDGDSNPGQLNADEVTFAQMLAGAGYRVGHIGVDHVRARPPIREAEWIDTYISKKEHGQYAEERGLEFPDMTPHRHECPTRFGDDDIRMTYYSAPNPGTHPFDAEDYYDFFLARNAADFIQEAGEDPYFLMAFFWMPHPPFVIPEPYISMYSPDDIELPANIPGTQLGKPDLHGDHLPGQVGAGRTEQEWREAWAAYFGCVTLVDDCIGMVLDAIEAREDGDETLIVFHPDHGEMLGAHEYFQKMVCYEEATHLPMMISAPGLDAGRRDCLTSHVDIAPTILDFAGADIPARIQGETLMPVLENPMASIRESAFTEYSGNAVLDPYLFQRSMVRGRFKYIWNLAGDPELYDLQDDPHEMQNLAEDPEYAEVVSDMAADLRQWREDTGDHFPDYTPPLNE